MTETETRARVLTGGCQCGAVRYAIFAAPKGANICHCRMCQKAVGGPFAALVANQPGDFAWTRGTAATFASSSIAARDYCRDCGTPLTYRGPSGRINVTVGSLDHPERVKPIIHYGVESRLAWLEELGHIAEHRTEEDMSPPALASLVNFQHPDSDTPDSWRPPSGAKATP